MGDGIMQTLQSEGIVTAFCDHQMHRVPAYLNRGVLSAVFLRAYTHESTNRHVKHGRADRVHTVSCLQLEDTNIEYSISIQFNSIQMSFTKLHLIVNDWVVKGVGIKGGRMTTGMGSAKGVSKVTMT